jgi:hypothetical protein
MDKVTQEVRELLAATDANKAYQYRDGTRDIYPETIALQAGLAQARLSAYAPEVVTPEVVETAARAMWAKQSDKFNQWATLDVDERHSLTDLANAALLAALATLRGGV